MGAISEMQIDMQSNENGCEETTLVSQNEQTSNEENQATNSVPVNDTAVPVDNQKTESDTVTDKKETDDKKKTEAEKKRAHEEAETKRKAEWEKKQKEKKEAEQKILDSLKTMTDDDALSESLKKIGTQIENITKRNMKACVSEHIQTLCVEDPEFAKLAMHPRKSLINCFKHINIKARDYLKAEMEANDENPESGGYGGDVPDGMCYQWADEYFRDADAEVDKEKEEKFVPKPYPGSTVSKSKSKKKENAKKSKEDSNQMQIGFGEAEAS